MDKDHSTIQIGQRARCIERSQPVNLGSLLYGDVSVMMRFVALYLFIALHIHCTYLPFIQEAKLPVMKETENYTCKCIATKSKSGTLYVWNNARCPCRSRQKLCQRPISFVNAAWIQSVKTTYPVALTTFSGIVFPL